MCIINTQFKQQEKGPWLARIQIVMPDADRARFRQQAANEGLSFSAWIRAAARQRCELAEQDQRFKCERDVREFFAEHDKSLPPGRGPDWDEYKAVIDEMPQGSLGRN